MPDTTTTLERLVLDHIREHPGCTSNDIARDVGIPRWRLNLMLRGDLSTHVRTDERACLYIEEARIDANDGAVAEDEYADAYTQDESISPEVAAQIRESLLETLRDETELDTEILAKRVRHDRSAVDAYLNSEENDFAEQVNGQWSLRLDAPIEISSAEQLERLRRKLLDLSRRNRLLNYRHPRGRSVRVVDELPNQLFKELYNGAVYSIDPLPQVPRNVSSLTQEQQRLVTEARPGRPANRDWAQTHDINPDYELPEDDADDGRHPDHRMQTLLYPEELSSRLKTVSGLSRTAIEESGANILYLAFGFLAWSENGTSEPNLAPLILLPVTLRRAEGGQRSALHRFTIEYSTEDVQSNLSLREKLEQAFGLELPEFDADEDPETYFEKCASLCRDKPGWRIHRYVTLGFFQFGKLLMYLDLDWKKWPIENSLRKHEIVRKILKGQIAESGEPSPLPNVDEIPLDRTEAQLVQQADSSQHGAIIDALEGRNLVIEGPPGTGKSQTITNIIASLLATNKSVLFVSEKLAALEVVRSNLETCGLGKFVLELHSHKTQKKRFYGDVAERLELSHNHDSLYDMSVAHTQYARARDQIKQYLDAVNTTVPDVGKTRKDLFCELAAIAEETSEWLPAEAELRGVDTGDIRDLCDKAIGRMHSAIQARDIFEGEYGPCGQLPVVWLVPERTPNLYQEAVGPLNEWRDALSVIVESIRSLFSEESERFVSREDVETLSQVAQVFDEQEIREIRFPVLGTNDLTSEDLQRLHQKERELKRTADWLGETLSGELWELPDRKDELGSVREELASVGSGAFEGLSVEQLERTHEKLDTFVRVLSDTVSNIAHFEGYFSTQFPTKSTRMAQLAKLLTLGAMAPLGALEYRSAALESIKETETLEAIKEKRDKILSARVKLGLRFDLEKCTKTEELRAAADVLGRAGWLPVWDAERRAAARFFKDISRGAGLFQSRKAKAQSLRVLAEVVEEKRSFEKDHDIWSILGPSFKGVDTPLEEYIELVHWQNKVYEQVGTDADDGPERARELIRLSTGTLQDMRTSEAQEVAQSLHQLSAAIGDVEKLDPMLADRIFGSSTDWKDILGTARSLTESLAPSISKMRHIFSDRSAAINRTLNKLTTFLDKVADEELSRKRSRLFSSQQLDFVLEEVQLSALGKMDKVLDLVRDKSRGRLDSAFLGWTEDESERWCCEALSLNDKIESEQQAQSLVRQYWILFLGDLTSESEEAVPVLELVRGLKEAVRDETCFDAWLKLSEDVDRLSDVHSGFDNLRVGIFRGVDSESLKRSINLLCYKRLAEREIEAEPVLREFSGRQHNEIIEKFRSLDNKLKELHQEAIVAQLLTRRPPPGQGGQRVKDLTEMALLKHQLGLQRNHRPIRTVMRRAGNALQAIKPCFMMGPLSVAQYLEPGNLNFDVVIFDEASQVRPEDAIGAIARGNQVVVVGDPKQLPPTSFFDTLADDEQEDDDEEYVFAHQESILEIAQQVYGEQQSRMLTWHYRSRHEGLIEFSNATFYNRKLHVFPTVEPGSQELGLHLRRVNDGRYENQANVPEAQALVAEAVEHIRTAPGKSLGIVAVNSAQARVINDELDRVLTATGLDLGGEEDSTLGRIFVKNLENVQGDERDVMMVSLTYGPDANGHVYRRFGPINREGGWRRLNVLFTRARQKMLVFTSMRSDQIVPGENAQRGAVALYQFLRYAETGILPGEIHSQAKRDPDSEFEIDVARAVQGFGLEVRCQVGEAGFYIDVGVIDPEEPSRYLLGIECDGAPYHSSVSARERDNIRQQILEDYGWQIHRIWSTDWYRRNAEERKRLKGVLQTALAEARRRQESAQETAIEHSEEPLPATNEFVEEAEIEEDRSDEDVEELLRTKLTDFREVVQSDFPETPPSRALLRDEMIHFLVEHQPLTIQEFQQAVPSGLRQSTDTTEAQTYLSAVLALIEGTLRE